MPLPYQYRDYPLAIFMAIVALLCGIFSLRADASQSVEITLSDSCCPDFACPVVRSLAALPESRRIRSERGKATTTFYLRTSRVATAKDIWDAVEAAERRPLRMVVDRQEYVSRPIN